MISLRFALLAVTCVVAVSAYGPPKKAAVLPPNPGKYDTVGSIAEKDYKKGQEDVLYVKGQPVEGGKEEIIDETDGSYGGKYGADKKVKEVKVEESGFDLAGGDYGGKPVGGKGHGKAEKAYGDDSYGKEVKEVKEVKYDAVDEKGPGKYGAGDLKGIEEYKEETKYGGGYGGDVVKQVQFKEEKKYGKGGYGGGHKKEIVKEEVIKETGYDAELDKGPEGKEEPIDDSGIDEFSHGWVGGYMPEAPKGGYGPVVPNPKESYGGYGKAEGKKGGYGVEEKYEETVKEVNSGYGGDKFGGPKGGFEKGKFGKEEAGYGGKGGYGKGGFAEEKIEETIKEEGAYGGPKGGYGKKGFAEEKIEETYKVDKDEPKLYGPKGGYGAGPKGGFGEEKIEETIKEGGYGSPKGGYGGKGGYAEEKIEETYKEGGYGAGKPLAPAKGFGYEKEIKSTKYGGGYGGDVVKQVEVKEEKYSKGGYGGDFGGYDGPKPGGSITTLSTKSCNKMMDGLLGKLQNTFTSHMRTVKVEKVSPLSIGSWARVRLYDGKFDKIGQICRGGDFQVLPQGENIVVRGTITVPEPKANFCGDAYLYNRLKVRNRNLALCAKDASFRVQMIINKRSQKIDVDELEPVAINGFHVEDDKGLRADALAWPFNKIRDTQLTKQKYQFMSTLQHKLCDDFRQVVARPEIKKEIISLV